MSDQHYSHHDVKFFDQFTNGYSPYSQTDLDKLLEPLNPAITRFANPVICEIGCASGQFSCDLVKHINMQEATIVGVDIASRVLAKYPFEKVCGSAFELPLKDSSLDIVCLPAALHHLFPLENTLSEINRVLKVGGVFYCIEPNFFHPQRRFFMRFKCVYKYYRKANDVPINPHVLENMLISFKLRVVCLKFITIEFNKPSLLQRVQNFISRHNDFEAMDKYISPWFLLLAEKK